MKSIIFWIMGIGIFLSPLISMAMPQDSTVQLTQLIQEALANNPDLKASYNAWQASKLRVPQAGSLPDPVLELGIMNLPVNSFDFQREPMTGKQIGLMQMFPFPGKLELKEKIAAETALIAEMQYQELQNQLIKSIKLTYYELYYNGKAIDVSQRNRALLGQFAQIAETRYRVGKGLQQDMLRAQVELAKIDEKIIQLHQNRVILLAQLKFILNRKTSQPIQGNFFINEIDSLKIFDLSDLKSLAKQNRPLLHAWLHMSQKSHHEVKLAKKSYLPDFSLEMAYMQRDDLISGMAGIDFLSGSIRINLPIYFWKKQSREVEESKYNDLSITQKYEYILREIERELESKWSELDKNRRLLELYKGGILTQASQAVKSALAAYQVDKVDFLTLVNNQTNLFQYELDYHRILSDYYKNIAELEALVGKEL